MAQVNIDVAKEASVQTVNTKVGTSSDTASNTPTTLFAGIKGLIAWFTGTWTAARAAKVDTIDTNTAVNNTASKTGALSQKGSYGIGLLENATYGLSALKSALTGGNVPIVKSLQRINTTLTATSQTFTISAVNTSKCLIVLDGIKAYSGGPYPPYITSFTSTSITINVDIVSGGGPPINCQIIEFY